MKTLHLSWLDSEGHGFKIETQGLWKFEREEIARAFRAVGYAERNPDLFMIADPAEAKDAPEHIRPALEAIGYAVVFHGDIPAGVEDRGPT